MSRKKSVEEHIRDGTYRKDRHGPRPSVSDNGGAGRTAHAHPPATAGEPKPPTKPASLTGDAAKLWNNLLGLLGSRVQESDGPALALLCTWWARFEAINAQLDALKAGTSEFGRCIIQAGICSDKVNKLASQFGLTPADRGKLKIEASGPVVARVPTRPKTKLDQQGPPKPA